MNGVIKGNKECTMLMQSELSFQNASENSGIAFVFTLQFLTFYANNSCL